MINNGNINTKQIIQLCANYRIQMIICKCNNCNVRYYIESFLVLFRIQRLVVLQLFILLTSIVLRVLEWAIFSLNSAFFSEMFVQLPIFARTKAPAEYVAEIDAKAYEHQKKAKTIIINGKWKID